jgi:prolyl-tRNA synthetase
VGLKLRIYADYAAIQVCNGVAGANKGDTHLTHVNVNRDYRPQLVGDLRMAVMGDPCPRCFAPLGFTHGIEVGHVFKLGTRYSKKMNSVFLDDKGQLHPMVMGCYGIGVNRIVAAAVENHHDDAGILWPRELAPYQVEIVSLDHKKLQIVETAHNLYDAFVKAGIEVLWDDRDAAPGVKFTDADLIGIPVRITVGRRTLESGTVDVKTRKNKDQKSVTLEQVAETVKHELENYRV